jgi:hypothetical protein
MLTAIQFRAEPRDACNSGLTSADSGHQLESGDRVKRCLSEDPAPSGFFSSAEDALKRRMT